MKPQCFYLDMDGVCADFAAGAAALVGYTVESSTAYYPPSDWAVLVQHQHIYRNLPLMPGSTQLVDLARQYRDLLGWQLTFLTAVPRANDMPWAFWDKMLWAQQHYPDIPVHFGPFSRDKHHHCRSGDILVDDRPDNCAAWTAAGGTAVWVQGRDLAAAVAQVREDLTLRLSALR